MATRTENYVRDLGKELVVLVQNAQRESVHGKDPFQKGRQMAFYEVLSLMKQQATAFGMDDSAIGLHGVNIESFLS